MYGAFIIPKKKAVVQTNFKITFENEIGKIDICGGSGGFIKCLAVEGLGIPQKEFNAVVYTNESGQRTQNARDLPRTITISGDLIGGQYELSYLNKVLYLEGILTFYLGKKVRCIKARCSQFGDPTRYGERIKNCVMQFTCDKPEFSDYVKTVMILFKRYNTFEDEFTLPCVFTGRVSEAVVHNAGDLKAEPVIKIKNLTDTTTLTPGVIVTNHTTGQHIMLNHTIKNGEEIVIDVSDRKVTSNTDGNIITSISDDTFLDDFWIDIGENNISVKKLDGDQDLLVTLEYSNLYVEAVY